MKKKLSSILKSSRKSIALYLTSNRLFFAYVVLALIGTILIRNFTIGSPFSFKPLISDLGAILLIGAFGYIKKPKKRYKYYLTCLIIFTIMEIVNSVYYTFYVSFSSFGELASLGQVKTVTGSLYEKFKLVDFIYVIIPITFCYIPGPIARKLDYKNPDLNTPTLWTDLYDLNLSYEDIVEIYSDLPYDFTEIHDDYLLIKGICYIDDFYDRSKLKELFISENYLCKITKFNDTVRYEIIDEYNK